MIKRWFAVALFCSLGSSAMAGDCISIWARKVARKSHARHVRPLLPHYARAVRQLKETTLSPESIEYDLFTAVTSDHQAVLNEHVIIKKKKINNDSPWERQSLTAFYESVQRGFTEGIEK
jgi:predicted nucleic acid binding AN1-type Zn finger protein